MRITEMKKIKVTGAAVTVALLLAGCAAKPQPQSAAQTQPPVDQAHNARNSLNWEGLYTGVIPAASGPGIEVHITLRGDLTYTASYRYLEQEDADFTVEGRFAWDAAGLVITLDTKDIPPYYRVGEERLIQLDMTGEPITGMPADTYVLSKQP
jgi:uncharacterized lipoprotein NlpE involved in copper resistance